MKYHVAFDIEFQHNSYPGLYIALEGIDGSGKTAQAQRLKMFFEKQGKKVITTREPRKSEGLLQTINQQILIGTLHVPKKAYQYLFTADRVMHFEDLVVPSLRAGSVVISDRCFWSAVPYGMWEREEEMSISTAHRVLVAQGILSMFHQFLVPDVVFYLDTSLRTALNRLLGKVGEREEIYEKEEILYHVLQGYQLMVKEYPKEFAVINAEQSIDEVTADMIEIIEKRFVHKVH